jgi:MoxR-like ATPase
VASATPADVPALQAWFEDDVLALPAATAPWLERAVQAFEKQLDLEQRMPAEDLRGDDEGAGKLALARAIGLGEAGSGSGESTAGPAMQRIVSERVEKKNRRRWGALHVQARVAQVSEIQAQVGQAQAAADAARIALEDLLAGRLWIPPATVARWRGRHHALQALLADFAGRLATVWQGFAALPVDERDDRGAPAPVPVEAAAESTVA